MSGWPYPDILPWCTCGPARNSDGSENGLCGYCEVIEVHEERQALNELHALEDFTVCPRTACGSEDVEVGPGNTARCNTCSVRW